MSAKKEAVLYVLFVDDEHVVMQTKSRGRHKGEMLFPGGKLNEGETLEEAVYREMQEELQIDEIPQVHAIGTYATNRFKIEIFMGRYSGDLPDYDDEGHAFVVYPLEQLFRSENDDVVQIAKMVGRDHELF